MTISLTQEEDALANARLTRPFRWGQWIAALIVTAVVVIVVRSAVRNPRFEWGTFRHYFFVHSILHGLWLTVWLTLLTFALGHILGVILLVMRLSNNPVLSTVSFVYTWLFRSIPPLVQLLLWFNMAVVYPLLTFWIPGVHIHTVTLFTPIGAAIIGLTLDIAAFAAEIMRGGVLSVDPGQTEAARALGFRKGRIFRRIVMPQAMKAIIPNTGNLLISMLKATSIVSVLGVKDLLFAVQIIYNDSFEFVPLLMVATIWYIILTTVLSIIQLFVERYYNRGQSQGSSASRRGFLSIFRTNAKLSPTVVPPVVTV